MCIFHHFFFSFLCTSRTISILNKIKSNQTRCIAGYRESVTMVGCIAQLAERRSLAGELTLSYARPVADG